jgi:hypothetical protein
MAVFENYEFSLGEDMSGIEPDMSVFGSGVGAPSYAGGNGEGAPDIAIINNELNSDGSSMFNDGEHPADGGGMDSMAGINSGAHSADLANADMWLEDRQEEE